MFQFSFVALPWTRSSRFCNLVLFCTHSTLSFFTGESFGISSHPFKQITHLSRLCFGGPVIIIIGVSSLKSQSRALSCLHIKMISCELQNISGNTVIKTKSVIFINITLLLLLLLQSTQRPRLHSHQSDVPQCIKTLDSTDLKVRDSNILI
jgi:hypothetical protein